ncbi:MAG: YeeE/YedE family protein [Rhizobiaceae bacterium]|nr:YeeE/YedE family protein [Hyphomicrobiales bacterium]NRB30031.1 YeeE/YedE family protein [Rhizobiaceae bacterium]
MTEFTPLASAFGGALIGLSAVLLLAINGRIAGISGISSAILPPWGGRLREGDIGWRIAFVVGLMAAPILVQAVSGEPIQQTVSSNVALMVIAGLVTGFGSVYGGGCTSGHGVCGMSRLSMRSITATLTFMATGFLTVFVMRHVVGG